MNIYINEGSFGFEMTPLEKASLISSSAFSGIGFWFEKIDIWIKLNNIDAQEFASVLVAKNVKVIEINFLKHLFTDDYESPELQNEIAKGIYYAKLLGAPFLTAATFGENIQPLRYKENIRKLSEQLEREGLLLAIEFLPWTEIPSITALQVLLESINRDNVGILLDTYHFFMGDPSLDALKKIPPERIFLIHANDLVEDRELFSRLSLIEITRGYRVVPGQGDFPLNAFFKTLREMGVEAPVSLEILNRESATREHIYSILNSYASIQQQMGA